MGGVYLAGATRNYTDWEPEIVGDAFEAQKVESDSTKRRQILKKSSRFLNPD